LFRSKQTGAATGTHDRLPGSGTSWRAAQDRRHGEILLVVALGIVAGVTSGPLRGQVESVEAPPAAPNWVSRGRIEGHLALNYSPAGAFSPNSATLAVATGDKIALMELRNGEVRKVLRPHVPDITDLQFQSANFLDPNHLLLLGTGLLHPKGEKAGGPTPLLAFQWDTERDVLSSKVNVVGPGGGFGPARYFPQIQYLGLYKESHFSLWNPVSGEGRHINLPVLTRQPGIFEFSPDGHWLLLAQIESSSTGDPVVVRLSEHQFVDSLRGHQGTVLSIAFTRDSKKVVTACEDGKVRIWSAPDWKLLATLAGHFGPVHRAEFSADGRWVASAGEDKTVRIWSVDGGKLEQTLEESQAPVLSVAFSPNDEFLAASTEQTVLVWERK
jgi:WD40 repeat protein